MKETKKDLKAPLTEDTNLFSNSLTVPDDSNYEDENKLTPYYKSNIFGKFFFNWTKFLS